MQRGCQREAEKSWCSQKALSLCTARLEIMELTIIIVIITTVDSPVLNHVRGQNFSCCSYSTLSLSLSLTYILYLPTFSHVEFDDDSLPPALDPPPLPPQHNQRTCVTYPTSHSSGVFDLPIHSFIQELT